MVLVDTSVWIAVLRNRDGEAERLRTWLDSRESVLARFTQLELLQGAKDEREWELLVQYLATQTYLDMQSDDWSAAARIFFDLRRRGLTVRSPIDCCIAQLALRHVMPLLHMDRDFDTIASVYPLQAIRFEP